MSLETSRWNVVDHLDSPEMIAAYMQVVFEIGEPDLIEAALSDIARACGLPAPLPATTDIPSLMRAMKTLGLELTAKAA